MAILVILFAGLPAMCADVDAGLPQGNESLPNDFLVIISPSHFQASVGDILNISYLVINKCNCTLMNVSLNTKENGSVLLNKTILLPRQNAVGIESVLLNRSEFSQPIIRSFQVSARNPRGKTLMLENSTSIELQLK